MAKSQIDVTKFLDLNKFVRSVEQGGRIEAGKFAEAMAKRYVQVDVGTLRDSIRWDGKDSITANTPYAAVQEYGRPGMVLDEARIVGIGYTPYLRPAALDTADYINDNQENIVVRIIDSAARNSKI